MITTVLLNTFTIESISYIILFHFKCIVSKMWFEFYSFKPKNRRVFLLSRIMELAEFLKYDTTKFSWVFIQWLISYIFKWIDNMVQVIQRMGHKALILTQNCANLFFVPVHIWFKAKINFARVLLFILNEQLYEQLND